MRTCVKCGSSITACDKWVSLGDGKKQHQDCVYPTMYRPSKADPKVRSLILQSLSHRRIQTHEELLLVLEEAKRLIQQSPEAQAALSNMRKQNGR